jgi:hypothetical protein
MPFTVLEDPDGKPVTAKATEEGTLRTAGEVSGPEGEALATEAEQQEQTAALETIASTVALAPGALSSDPGVNAKISSSVTLPVEIVAGQTATATPDAAATGIVTRLAGVTTAPAGEAGTGLEVVSHQAGEWSVTANQGRANPDERWSVTDTTTEAAVAAVEVELQDKALDTSVDEVEGKLDTGNASLDAIDDKTPLGPTTMAGSRPIVFATDHPPVAAELYVGLTTLSNSNPVPVRGIVPSRTSTGTPAFASSGQVGTDGAGALFYLRMHVPSPAGTRYILLFDAAAATPLATSNMIPGITFPFTPTLGRAEQRFGYPVGFVNGLQWAVSSTEHTYTASADTANVFAQWVMS